MHDLNELARVTDKITPHILAFFEEHGAGSEFTLHEITLYVMQRVVCSPTSPYRVMALLRQNRVLNYVCVSRRESRYAILSVDGGLDDTIEFDHEWAGAEDCVRLVENDEM